MIPELKNTLIKGEHYLDEMNATCCYYPILVYLFSKFTEVGNILEIGMERGYGAYYLARAAKEKGGMYYGIDIEQDYCDKIDKLLTDADLPHKIICADTKKMEKIDFVDRIDLAFIDGEHTTTAVMHEVEMIYPLMPSGGWGYIFLHDIVDGGVADAWWKLKNDDRFETMGTNQNYGLGIARKIEGIDYEAIAKRLGIIN